jgi:hypothetical protein
MRWNRHKFLSETFKFDSEDFRERFRAAFHRRSLLDSFLDSNLFQHNFRHRDRLSFGLSLLAKSRRKHTKNF